MNRGRTVAELRSNRLLGRRDRTETFGPRYDRLQTLHIRYDGKTDIRS